MSVEAERYQRLGMTEAYEVVRTIEVVTRHSQTCRIEVLRDVLGDRAHTVRYYVRAGHDAPWTQISASWVHEKDADHALDEAIGWLSKWANEHSSL